MIFIMRFYQSVISVTLILSCLFLASCGDRPESAPGENTEQVRLKVFAGAGLRRAMDELGAAFEEKTGVVVDFDYGGSGMIISRAKEDNDADLFMPGDVWYVDRLHELTGKVQERVTVSYFVPTIIVQAGNPKNVKTLQDFKREDLVAALGNAEACQVGRLCVKIFENAGMDRKSIDAKESLTVNELGVWVKMGDADAAIVWDAIAANIADSTEMIEIPREYNEVSTVVAGLLNTSRHPEQARQFMEFMLSEAGQTILRGKGYRTDTPYGDGE
jgi:molybdate transport system substrate-binding protein